MNHYNNDYFFILPDQDDDCLPELMPDSATAERRFRYERQPADAPPLVFSNGFKTDFQRAGIRERVADILFDGSQFMVRTRLRERLMREDIANMAMHPAVYVDDGGRRHEDYWYLAFTAALDCWDRDASDYEDEPMVIGKSVRHAIYSYSLDSTILDCMPLNARLLFEMGGTTDGRIVCHRSLVHLFEEPGNGARVVPVA